MIWRSCDLASRQFLPPISLRVFPPSPLSFISIGDHRLVCLSPSAWTNISLHAAVLHSSTLPSGVPYSSLSIISPALPPSRYLARETVWIQLHWWRSRLRAWLLHTDHWTSICVSTCLYHCCPFEESLMDWFLSCRAINKLPLPLKYVCDVFFLSCWDSTATLPPLMKQAVYRILTRKLFIRHWLAGYNPVPREKHLLLNWRQDRIWCCTQPIQN